MSRRTRVKICGITRLDDALLAAQLGADALGFVFCQASARYISPSVASKIIRQLPPFVTPVGLFLDAGAAEINVALELNPALLPQFHGQESPAECQRYGRPYVKAIGVGSGMPSHASLSEYESALAFLFDSNEPGKLGGTGHAFNWQQLDQQIGRPVILAGGLNVNNIKAAIAQVRPFAVDVSTGVERAKGIKNPDALRAFMQAVQRADKQFEMSEKN